MKKCKDQKREIVSTIAEQRSELEKLKHERKRCIQDTRETLQYVKSTYERLQSDLVVEKETKNYLDEKLQAERQYVAKWRKLKVYFLAVGT